MKTEVVHTLTAAIPDHFADTNKVVDLGSDSQREMDDIMLTNKRFSRFPEMMP